MAKNPKPFRTAVLALLVLAGGLPAEAPALSANPPRFPVRQETGKPLDTTFLRAQARRAAEVFSRHFGPIPALPTLRITDRECFRTGYRYEEQDVVFCGRGGVVLHGITNADVIHHELFHAFLCAQQPELCESERLKEETTVALHEALADYFAFRLNPDTYFGEGYYAAPDRPFIRRYRSDMCHSLIRGAHDRGNALAAGLIRRQVSFRQVREFLDRESFDLPTWIRHFRFSSDPCYAENPPEMEVTPEGVPPSRLGKYWLAPEGKLKLRFRPNDALRRAYPAFQIQWSHREAIPRFRIETSAPEPDGAVPVTLTPLSARGTDKLVATFRLPTGQRIGFEVLYLGIRSRTTP